MASEMTRRRLLVAVAAGSALAACERMAVGSGFLESLGRWNARVDRFLFGPARLAGELPPAATTPGNAFPSYFISDDMPFPPAGWTLKVGGLVARPTTFSLDQLQQMTRIDMRVRHHCVEGWSAVASWHGVRLREIAEAVGADPHAGYVEFRSFGIPFDRLVSRFEESFEIIRRLPAGERVSFEGRFEQVFQMLNSTHR